MADDPLVLHASLMADLIRDNDAVAKRMLQAYAALYKRLTADWLQLLDEIALVRDEQGAEAAFSYLQFRTQRVQDLRIQTALQIDRFTRDAERLVTAEQARAIAAGQTHAQIVTTATARIVEPTVRTNFSMLPTRALENLVGRFSNGMPLRTLFDDVGPASANNAQSVIFDALATGQHPRVAARRLRTQLGIPLTRALTISRTEMLGAYRTSTLLAYNENSHLVRAWRWNAHLDETTCPSCWALHGSIHPLTERMHEHVNGRCAMSPVLVSADSLVNQSVLRAQLGIDRIGPEAFAMLSAASKRAILGKSKYALLEEGRIDVGDLITADYSSTWGLQYREASIAQALANHQSGGLRMVYDLAELGL